MRSRIRLVQQNDRTDCGAAALATLALHYQREASLEHVRQLTGTGRDGATLAGLCRGAGMLGLRAKALRCQPEHLWEVPLPAVAHTLNREGAGHFVVVFRVRKSKVLVGDPAGEVRWHSRDAFLESWTGNLLVAQPETATHSRRSGPSKPQSRWSKFLSMMAPHRGLIAEAIVCALLMTCLATTTSFFIQQLVDNVLVRGEKPLLHALGIGMTLVMVFRVLFSSIRQYLLFHVGRKVDLQVIGDFLVHLSRLPLRFFESRQSGEILSRVTDAGKLRDVIQGAATSAIVDGLVVVGMLAILWFFDLPLALVVTCVAPLFLLTVAAHHPAAVRTTKLAMEQGAQLAAHLVEDVGGIETIKMMRAESLRAHRGQNRLVDFVRSLAGLQRLDLQVSQLSLLLTSSASLGVLWYGGLRVISGELSIGQLLFFFTMLSTLLEPLSRLATVNLQLQDALTALDRLQQILELEPEADPEQGTECLGCNQHIELRDVQFAYTPGVPVLAHLSFDIPAGKTTAIVGESGCGKSTLLRLLTRLYLPDAGQVLLDGIDLRDFRLDSLRRGIGVVTQEPYIFNGTLAANLALAAPTASLAEMGAALRGAQLESWMQALPARFETLIGERGANLSGGQKQRLAIARVLLANPDIVLFDEATSHLDTATEQAIHQSVRERLQGKTIVMVAHRLSTIQHAEQIIVLDHGRLLQRGTHAELIAQEGKYRQLWYAQSGQSQAVHQRPLVSCPPISCSQGVACT